MELVWAAVAGFIVWLSLAPAPRETVTVLPEKDGKVGTVVVETAKGTTILNSAFATARISPSGGVENETANSAKVQRDFSIALAAQPARPSSFTLYFEIGTDQFTEESRQEAEHVLVEVSRRPAPDVTVTGHADLSGDDESNDELSIQRAQRIKTLLVQMGIPDDRIIVAGRGKREPAIRTPDGVPEPRNRRVEVSVR